MISTVYISLGSNVGDRRGMIGRALAKLCFKLPVRSMRTSEYYCSSPLGFASENEFVNIAAALCIERSEPWTQSDALAVLDVTQAVERELSSMPHRNADGSYRDREIDIDIIAIDDLVVDTPRLTLPHPRAAERPFVAVPLLELGSQL